MVFSFHGVEGAFGLGTGGDAQGDGGSGGEGNYLFHGYSLVSRFAACGQAEPQLILMVSRSS
jgi:hypothetical protein